MKRKAILKCLHHRDTAIAFLQETHLRREDVHRLYSTLFPLQYHSPGPKKSKGVAILFRKGLRFVTKSTHIDKEGRLLLVKGILEDLPITLATIYAPLEQKATFFMEIFGILAELAESLLIFGGDFNATIDSRLDHSNTQLWGINPLRPLPPLGGPLENTSCRREDLYVLFPCSWFLIPPRHALYSAGIQATFRGLYD